MDDSLDQYSLPVKSELTKLSTIYWLNSRDSKKGRRFTPVYDQRFPLKFRMEYGYISKFLEKNNASGNHYHLVKQEILIPLQGEFEIRLEDIKTKDKEMIKLNSEENKAIYIKTGISHKIVSKDTTGILLVLASAPSSLQDEFEYLI